MTAASETDKAEAAREWRAHWPLVVSACLGISLLSIGAFSMGAFMEPLQKEFGWGRADIAAGLSIYAVLGIFLAPLVGVMIDKWGPRRVAVPGAFFTGACFALFGTTSGSQWHWLALWLLFTLAAQFIKTMVWTAAVSSVFRASRGLALAVTLGGSGVGGIIAPVLASTLTTHYGWRAAYGLMGVGWGGIVALCAYFWFFGLQDRGGRVAAAAQTPVLPGLTVREGLTSASFAKIAGCAFMLNLLLIGLNIHLLPMLMGGGLSREAAMWITGLSGAAIIAGKLIAGALLDRMHGRLIGAAWFAAPVLPCLLLFMPHQTIATAMLTAVLLGSASGAQLEVVVYLCTRYFGLRSFGTIFGVIGSLLAASTGIGPFAAGKVYDLYHAYGVFLGSAIPLFLVCSAVIASLGPYPQFVPEPAKTDPVSDSPGTVRAAEAR